MVWIVETQLLCGRARHDYLKGRPADNFPLTAMKQALVRRVTLLLGGKSDQAGPQRGEVPVQSGSPTSESYGEGFASPAWPRAATSTAPWRTVGEHVGSDWAQTGCNGARRSDLLKELRALQSRARGHGNPRGP